MNPAQKPHVPVSSTFAKEYSLLKATLDSSLDMIQVFEAVRDENGKIIDFIWVLNNHVSERIYGNVIGKRLLVFNPGVEEECIFDTFVQVVETGIPQQRERHYSHEQFNGWFYQSVVKLGDGVATTTSNITNLKKAEQELRQSKSLLQKIIDAPNIGIAVYKALRNGKGEIIDFVHEYINRASLDMLGGNDFTGKLFTDHGENAVLQLPQFIEVIETGRGNSYVREADFRGRKVWFAITNTPLDEARLVHTWEDVTERKNVEEENLRLKDEIAQNATNKYYSIFNSIEEGFCIYEVIYDDNGEPVDLRWIEVNPAYEKQTGLKDVIGKSHRGLSLATEQYWLDIYDKVAKTGDATYFENWHEPTGRWYHVFTSKIGEADSRQVAVVFEDITERKQRERQQEYLLKLNEVLRSTADSIEIEEKVTAVAMDYFGADRCYFCTIEGEDSIIRRDARKEGLPSVAGRYPLSSFALFNQVIKGGVSFVVNDAHTTDLLDESLRAICLQLQVVSFVDVPIIKNGQAVGILCLVQSTPRVWTSFETRLVVETAERIWATVERARAEEALRHAEEAYRQKLEQEVQERTHELKENQEELEQERFFLEQVTDKTPLLIYVYDLLEQRFTYINKRVSQFIGRDQEYVYAMGPHLFQAILHPDDVPIRAGYMSSLATLQHGEIRELEFRIWTGSSFRWFRSRDSIFQKEDLVIRQIIGIAEDITYEKMVQEQTKKSSGPIGLN